MCSRNCFQLKQLGQDSQERTVGTGQTGQDSQRGQLRKGRLYRIAETGQLGCHLVRNSQDTVWTAGTGSTGTRHPGLDISDRTAKTLLTGQDSHDKKARRRTGKS
jgi:hypothetical protein